LEFWMSNDEKVVNGLKAWLKERGPNDWHEVANAYNWDREIAPLVWIVSQPTCDRATAATLFWRSSPGDAVFFNSLEDAKKGYNASGYQITKAILDRLKQGGYSRREIAYKGTSFCTETEWLDFTTQKGKTITLPAWLWKERQGLDLSRIRYTEGLPRPMVEWVWPDWPDGWGD